MQSRAPGARPAAVQGDRQHKKRVACKGWWAGVCVITSGAPLLEAAAEKCSAPGAPSPLLPTPPPPRTGRPRRHQLSLYAHISKITWHFDKQDRVAGTVSSGPGGDLRKFELDPQELGEFDIVNALWDMMGGK